MINVEENCYSPEISRSKNDTPKESIILNLELQHQHFVTDISRDQKNLHSISGNSSSTFGLKRSLCNSVGTMGSRSNLQGKIYENYDTLNALHDPDELDNRYQSNLNEKIKGRRNEKLGSIEKTGDEGHFRRTKMGSICVAQICLHKRLSKRGAFEKIDFLTIFGLFSVLHKYSSTCAKKFDQKSRGRV